MENRRVYVCPNCKHWYSHEADEKTAVCPNCHHELVEADIDYAYFSRMTKEEKANAKQQYLATHELPMTPYVGNEEEASSGWISGLNVFSWVAFFAIIIAGLVLAAPFLRYAPSYGVLIIIGAFLLAFLSVAGTMVFLGMASDLKAIRKNLESMKKNNNPFKKMQKERSPSGKRSLLLWLTFPAGSCRSFRQELPCPCFPAWWGRCPPAVRRCGACGRSSPGPPQ